MTPTYHQDSPPPSPKPQAPSSSSLSSYVFTDPIQDHGGIFHSREEHQLNYQQEAPNLASQDGSNDHQTPESESDHGLKSPPWKKENGSHKNHSDQNGSAERVPTKKRFILKMIKLDSGRADREAPIKDPQMKFEEEKPQASSSSSNYCNIPIRVCSDCNTTETPLWRSGPRGPKSLCNACGIRQRKARRAMAVAAASAPNGTAILGAPETPTVKTEVQNKEKRSSKSSHVSRHKKRSKIGHTATSHGKKKKICFEEFLISLSKNLAFHRVLPQDEKEAAILLMALSSGLLHG